MYCIFANCFPQFGNRHTTAAIITVVFRSRPARIFAVYASNSVYTRKKTCPLRVPRIYSVHGANTCECIRVDDIRCGYSEQYSIISATCKKCIRIRACTGEYTRIAGGYGRIWRTRKIRMLGGKMGGKKKLATAATCS